jgi:hypothetical protein
MVPASRQQKKNQARAYKERGLFILFFNFN